MKGALKIYIHTYKDDKGVKNTTKNRPTVSYVPTALNKTSAPHSHHKTTLHGTIRHFPDDSHKPRCVRRTGMINHNMGSSKAAQTQRKSHEHVQRYPINRSTDSTTPRRRSKVNRTNTRDPVNRNTITHNPKNRNMIDLTTSNRSTINCHTKKNATG